MERAGEESGRGCKEEGRGEKRVDGKETLGEERKSREEGTGLGGAREGSREEERRL